MAGDPALPPPAGIQLLWKIFIAFSSDPDGLDGPMGPISAGIPEVACEDRPGPRDEVPVQLVAAGGSEAPATQPSGVAAQLTSKPRAGGVPIAPISLLAVSAVGAGIGLRRLAR